MEAIIKHNKSTVRIQARENDTKQDLFNRSVKELELYYKDQKNTIEIDRVVHKFTIKIEKS